jgi:serine/threonine protein phosphatase PrpC
MQGEIEPHTVVRPVELLEGDAFLLCTDGWWEEFDRAELPGSVARALTPEDWLAEMRARIVARARPGQDNFSAIAVWAGTPGEIALPGADDTVPRGGIRA